MNKLAIQETFPPGIVGREIVLAQMCHHYRRISTAKARVDTNLFKPPKLSLSRPLSAEVASIVQRCMSPRSPPKHRICLKYEHEMGEHHIKPSTRSQTAESRLRSTPEVYHPAVKSPKAIHQESEGQQQATQTSLENSLIEDPTPKTKDEAVQTSYPGLYRPLDARSVQFLRDITTDALQRRAFTSSALNRVFLDHQFRNTYSLTQELMDRELEELRRQLGMLPRYHASGTTVSDGEALDALDTLVLDPRIKEQVIHSLRLSRKNDAKRPTYTYFDRLKENTDNDQQPTRDKTNMVLSSILMSTDLLEDSSSVQQVEEIPQENYGKDRITTENMNGVQMQEGGWNAEIEEDDRDITTASSSKMEGEEDEEKSDEEEVESMTDSEDEVEDIQSGSGSSIEDVHNEPDDETEDEITQKESTTSRQITDEHSNQSGNNMRLKATHDAKTIEPTESPLSKPDQNNTDKVQQSLPPLKLEPMTARDKWRSSLDVVKEESDSTSGQISDISTASTPTEIESKQDRTTSIPSSKPGASASSSTYFSAEKIQQTNNNTVDESVLNEETKNSASHSNSGNQTSSSTGGEIVRQMGDLLQKEEEIKTAEDSNGSLGQIVKHMSDLSDTQDTKQVIHKNGGQPGSVQEDNKSETGSEVESVHSETEDEDEAETSEASEISSVHTD